MGNHDLLRRISERLDLREEALPGIPLLELIGADRILIENHRGVCELGEERITVCVKYGLLSIHGRHLQLKKISGCQLVISGRIELLQILEGGSR